MTSVTPAAKSRFVGPIIGGVVLAIIAHMAAIQAIPQLIMSIATKRIADQAGGWNRLYHAPQVNAQNQRIVRSSPDLAYSTCALDLTNGPVRAQIGKGADYVSVALYGANTDNVFSLNDRAMGQGGARLLIVHGDAPDLLPSDNETLVKMPSPKALLLVRRLAPTDASFAAADTLRQSDVCQKARP